VGKARETAPRGEDVLDLAPFSSDSLCVISPRLLRRRPDGSLQFDGKRPVDPGRPDEKWHAHGYFRRSLVVLIRGARQTITVWKRRWRLVGTNRTTHSRPPDDAPRLRYCTLIVVLMLWGWFGHGGGLDDQRPVLAALNEGASTSTLRRWGGRAQRCALAFQQAIRHTLIERSEPRPVERLFPGGLSPPPELQRRRWQDPSAVSSLWRALAMTMYGAAALRVPVATLLAEARGRWEGPGDSVLP